MSGADRSVCGQGPKNDHGRHTRWPFVKRSRPRSGYLNYVSGVMAARDLISTARPSTSHALRRHKIDMPASTGSPPRNAAGCHCAGMTLERRFDLIKKHPLARIHRRFRPAVVAHLDRLFWLLTLNRRRARLRHSRFACAGVATDASRRNHRECAGQHNRKRAYCLW
jgi:hypothetical protein